jgi:hypothetical protein
MEITRKISELNPPERALIERLFGSAVNMEDSVVILRAASSSTDLASTAADATGNVKAPGGDRELPTWCNVLDGFSEAELAQFDALIESPVRLTLGMASDGPHTP